MSSFVILSHSGKKLVKGQLWAEVTQVTIWGHMSFTQYAPSHMRPFLFECHISLCYIFAVEEVRGHDFWTHLKMCVEIFDLLPLLWNSGTVNGKMRS